MRFWALSFLVFAAWARGRSSGPGTLGRAELALIIPIHRSYGLLRTLFFSSKRAASPGPEGLHGEHTSGEHISGERTGGELEQTRRFPVHPRVSTRTCIAAASGPCASTRASAPPRKATPVPISLRQGTTGLSVAFDLPTQMGMDSDHPLAAGEVGRVGVAIASLEDMERLFEGIRLDQVSTSMTINSTAAILLAFMCWWRASRAPTFANSPELSKTTF